MHAHKHVLYASENVRIYIPDGAPIRVPERMSESNVTAGVTPSKKKKDAPKRFPTSEKIYKPITESHKPPLTSMSINHINHHSSLATGGTTYRILRTQLTPWKGSA